MDKVAYILTRNEIPIHIYTSFELLEEASRNWMNQNYDNFILQQEYFRGLEDRTWYPNTDDGEEQAWNDFVTERIMNGKWLNYAWIEAELD